MASDDGSAARSWGVFGAITFGVILLVIGIFGLDPDVKLSDDGDPFGPPPSLLDRAIPFVLSGFCFVSAWWLKRARAADR